MQIGTSTLLPRPSEPLVPLEFVSGLLKGLVPDLFYYLSVMARQPGWIRYPDWMIRGIKNLRIENYPRMYENEAALYGSFLRIFYEDDEIKKLGPVLDAAAMDERVVFFNELQVVADRVFDFDHLPISRRDWVNWRRWFQALPAADQIELWQHSRRIWVSLLANYNQILSVMLHGEPLTALLARAKTGTDDGAYLKAMQVDNRIYTAIPEFREVHQRAREQERVKFYDAVNRRMFSSPFSGQIKRPALHVAFSMLEWLGWFKRLSIPELGRVLDQVGFDDSTHGYADLKGLAKSRRGYEVLQEQLALSTQQCLGVS